MTLVIGALYFIISYTIFNYAIFDLFDNEHQPINNSQCKTQKKKFKNKANNWCKEGKLKFISPYGKALNPPINHSPWRPNPGNDPKKAVHHSFGCSMNKKYCDGPIQSIPCCTKIAYDVWYKLDEYFTKHNVSYSLRWGSLLFAIRNGRHMPYDGRDIDIGFLRPENAAKLAINEFLNDYNVVKVGPHLIDVGVFYKLHHAEYGYPDESELHCFVNFEFTMDIAEYLDAETLMLAGNMFIDYGFGNEGANGMDTEYDGSMIPIQYDGSNGIKAPRQLFTYPDFYKHLNDEYGEFMWMDVVPPFISDKQLEYHGLNRENMEKYWKKKKEEIRKHLNGSCVAQKFAE